MSKQKNMTGQIATLKKVMHYYEENTADEISGYISRH